jgi:hypothetical protein
MIAVRLRELGQYELSHQQPERGSDRQSLRLNCFVSGCQSQHSTLAVIVVAAMTTVGEPRADFSQIGHPDGLTAQDAERILARRSAIHQDESHVAPGTADLKFLLHLPQARLRNLKSKSGVCSALLVFEVRDRDCRAVSRTSKTGH